ncbi:hypothetical protein [uncultured Mediterranean phage uvMED]|nr:hypothetical protein [uncultured Mediterranean phage uvMED]BAR17174.1 hypothetical protein [uncultured Mediterranean phage uvMED]BAR17235.1 hypothetical protein [uncultured Mediterranean phage uvMED]BAR17308.1 hypothetical protein [uncultured Mediterranean phage uvMED]BAR17378.1 hypothetical protein [uncultured Mediterranean phage uvMED]
MAHFAKLDENNLVLEVIVVADSDASTEAKGQTFLQNLYKNTSTYKQTSYNTIAGEHKLGGTAFRKNYAGVGYTYDASKDAFIPPKPWNSWTLNEDTCQWEAPVAYPDDGKGYIWKEDSKTWIVFNGYN